VVPTASPYSGSSTYSRPPQNTTESGSDLAERERGREREILQYIHSDFLFACNIWNNFIVILSFPAVLVQISLDY
jgi:hypothetical protein